MRWPPPCHSIENKYPNFMSVPDLEKAISQLSAQELSQFAAWFEEYMSDEWDKQIERDVAAGKLDHLIRKADEDIKAGRFTPL